eukprot:g5857.t1
MMAPEWLAVTAASSFYTLLLVLPMFPIYPELIIRLSFFFTVVVPAVGALVIVLVSWSSLSPSWDDQLGNWKVGVHGDAPNQDFCEENYRYSPWVAEFHNVWSSLPIVFYGSLGSYVTRKYCFGSNQHANDAPHARTPVEWRFLLGFCSIGAIGVGSMLFHGTLLRWGQILDEVPMLGLLFCGLYCFIESGPTPRYGAWLPAALVTSFVAFVGTYLVLNYYLFFLVGFSGGVTLSLSYGFTIVLAASKMSKALFAAAAASIALGATVWIIDDLGCHLFVAAGIGLRVQALRLHIGWHIMTGLGGYFFGLFLLSLRAKPLRKTATVVVWCPGYGGYRVSEDLSYKPAAARPTFFLPYVQLGGTSAGGDEEGEGEGEGEEKTETVPPRRRSARLSGKKSKVA